MTSQHVSTKRNIYVDPDLEDWPALTVWFYRWLYENDHAHGITGIGKVGMKSTRTETRMNTEQIRRAKDQIGEKVLWFADGTYWVKARAEHTCWTSQGNLHSKFAAGACNFMCEQPIELFEAFKAYYPEIIGDASPTRRRSIGNPVGTTVTGTVTVAGTGIKDPPPTSPETATFSGPLPKRVGGFLSRSGNERQKDDFYAFLGEMQTRTDVATIKRALTELNGSLADKSPTNLVAYARPIFERHAQAWQEARRLDIRAAETERGSEELDKRLAKDLADRLAKKESEGEGESNEPTSGH